MSYGSFSSSELFADSNVGVSTGAGVPFSNAEAELLLNYVSVSFSDVSDKAVQWHFSPSLSRVGGEWSMLQTKRVGDVSSVRPTGTGDVFNYSVPFFELSEPASPFLGAMADGSSLSSKLWRGVALPPSPPRFPVLKLAR